MSYYQNLYNNNNEVKCLNLGYNLSEANHEHPLEYSPNIISECNLCRNYLDNQKGYKCEKCQLFLCSKCSKRICYCRKRKSAHPHNLFLSNRNLWTCGKCNHQFKGGASFCCKKCKFDVCSNCFLLDTNSPYLKINFEIDQYLPYSEGEPMKEPEHPLIPPKPNLPLKMNPPNLDNPKMVELMMNFQNLNINDNIPKIVYPQIDSTNYSGYSHHPIVQVHEDNLYYNNFLSGECQICRNHLKNEQGYLCEICALMLCFNCGNRISNGYKQTNLHQHLITLRMRQGWKCDICNRSFSGGASFYCQHCDFDACESCYIK